MASAFTNLLVAAAILTVALSIFLIYASRKP